MSVQSEFFDSLYTELVNRGVDPAVAQENVTKFREQLTSRAKSEEQLDSALSKIPPASIAENIYNMIRSDSGDSDAGAKSEVMVIDTDSDTVETTVREGKDAVAPLAADETSSEESLTEEESLPEEELAGETEEESLSSEAPGEAVDESSEEEFSPETSVEESSETLDSESFFDGNIEGLEDNGELDSLDFDGKEEDDDDVSIYAPEENRRIRRSDEDRIDEPEHRDRRKPTDGVDLFLEEESSNNTWLFVIMSVVLIPIAFILGAVLFAAFIALWLALAVVITLLLVGLVALVGAGSAVALAGALFGVIELISGNSAAGMFEIGLALIVGAITMFAGIWLYNFAIRFIPFIIKKLGVLLIKIFALFKKAFRKIKELTSRI